METHPLPLDWLVINEAVTDEAVTNKASAESDALKLGVANHPTILPLPPQGATPVLPIAPPPAALTSSPHWPTAEDLLESDETPVDSELQERLPNLLALILADIWAGKLGWFFGIDMALYYSPSKPAIVPDAFLSLGVDRIKDENLRLSYVVWQENNILPQLALEVVSRTYRGEYSSKKELYRSLDVLYYVIYNSRRRRKPTLEVHKLVDGNYVQVLGQPEQGHWVWMPEIGLGIGKERFAYQDVTRDWLFWYDEAGVRYPTPQERAEQERKRAEQAQERVLRLGDRLRELGIDPDAL